MCWPLSSSRENLANGRRVFPQPCMNVFVHQSLEALEKQNIGFWACWLKSRVLLWRILIDAVILVNSEVRPILQAARGHVNAAFAPFQPSQEATDRKDA